MKPIATFTLLCSLVFTHIVEAGQFTIGGFTFDEADSVQTATIVESAGKLKTRSDWFAKYSDSYLHDATVLTNDFAQFDRSKTIGRLLITVIDRRAKNSSRHVLLPDSDDAPPSPNTDRYHLELSWNGNHLRNQPGNDFVIYEVGNWEGFTVAVLKTGSTEWTPPRYQFADSFDVTHVVNAVAFDLSKLGIAENESISAIRIGNLFNEKASAGADRVDDKSGQGKVIFPDDEKYSSSFPLLTKPGGKGFSTDMLGADIVYVAGLHHLEPQK